MFPIVKYICPVLQGRWDLDVTTIKRCIYQYLHQEIGIDIFGAFLHKYHHIMTGSAFPKKYNLKNLMYYSTIKGDVDLFLVLVELGVNPVQMYRNIIPLIKILLSCHVEQVDWILNHPYIKIYMDELRVNVIPKKKNEPSSTEIISYIDYIEMYKWDQRKPKATSSCQLK